MLTGKSINGASIDFEYLNSKTLNHDHLVHRIFSIFPTSLRYFHGRNGGICRKLRDGVFRRFIRPPKILWNDGNADVIVIPRGGIAWGTITALRVVPLFPIQSLNEHCVRVLGKI